MLVQVTKLDMCVFNIVVKTQMNKNDRLSFAANEIKELYCVAEVKPCLVSMKGMRAVSGPKKCSFLIS